MSRTSTSSSTINAASGYLKRLKRLKEYENTVARLFPALPKSCIDRWSLPDADALALSYFLDCYPRKAIVLDIGTFVGMSAFYFAIQPTVLRVVSVDPNPAIADEINDKSEILGTRIKYKPLQHLRVLDVAKAALREFVEEGQKIQLRVGVVGSTKVSVKSHSLDGLKKVKIPTVEPSDQASLVAFVDGLHTKEGVQADLEAIFESDPHAIAIMHDCRGPWGPFVQAGFVSFIETAEQKYHFHLVERMGPGLGTPNLGIVYSDIDAAEMEHTILRFQNPLRFLSQAVRWELQDPLYFLQEAISLGVPAVSRKMRRILRSGPVL